MNCSPPGSSDHGDSPGKNTGVGCHSLLQGIFPTQGSNLGLLHCRQILQFEPPGNSLGAGWKFWKLSRHTHIHTHTYTHTHTQRLPILRVHIHKMGLQLELMTTVVTDLGWPLAHTKQVLLLASSRAGAGGDDKAPIPQNLSSRSRRTRNRYTSKQNCCSCLKQQQMNSRKTRGGQCGSPLQIGWSRKVCFSGAVTRRLRGTWIWEESARQWDSTCKGPEAAWAWPVHEQQVGSTQGGGWTKRWEREAGLDRAGPRETFLVS